MTALLLTVFTASLLGSLHCAGMCGPFCAVAVAGGARGERAWRCQLAYHGGRLVTYALLGAAAGSLGALLNLASTLAGLQPIALGMAGGAMILIGSAELARLCGWRGSPAGGLRVPSAWTRLLQRGQRFASQKRGVPRALTIGLLTTLLPCGWLYAFLVTAAGAGGALAGAIVMAAFWLGTVPVLLSLGVGVRGLASFFGQRLPVVTAAALIIVGMVTLSNRSQLSAQALATTVTAETTTTTSQVPDLTKAPACCRGKELAP